MRSLDAMTYIDVNGLRGVTLAEYQVQLLAPALAAGIGIVVQN